MPGNRSTAVHATRVRCRIPARLLRAIGTDSRLVRRRENPMDGPIDTLIIQDPVADECVDVARAAVDTGTTVLADLSDPTLARTDIARRVIEHASAVTVRAGGLAAAIEHPVVTTVDDAVEWTHPSPPIANRPRPGEPARIVWFGRGAGRSPGTGLDELAVIEPVLAELATRRRIELVLVTELRAAAVARLRSSRVPGRWVDWSPWRLRSVLGASHVCLLPVGPDDAARARSANRAVTSLVQGVPVIAGAVPAYEALGAGVTFGSWATNIERLLADQSTAEVQVAAGRETIATRFSDEAVTAQWMAAIMAATERSALAQTAAAPVPA